ncbi:hypothetical protein DNU06_04010 [Putridiphycobacter roseus]|uniref:histidine kinase n=1 Tax=Putridiphycobacter roseus TaxID=2219161 RepID=A0A2W1NQ80_9FLAO|nr:transporter substrate-binding domain-containing protein [Putridiphycobacter roseus]PZE17792.1 hypothetical protein DNU06_04010 [Putridiphycobacter roseus]
MKYYLFLILFFTCFFNFGQKIEFTAIEKNWIAAHPIIHFGYVPDWAPYEFYENSKHSGIVSEYVKIISKETGITLLPLIGTTWEETISGLKSGTINMASSCAINKERNKYLKFTEPIISDPIIIATKINENSIVKLEDLMNKTIGLPQGFWTIDLIAEEYKNIKIVEYKTISECLSALSFGEIDAVVGSLGVISYQMNHKGYTNLKIAGPSNYDPVQIAMAFTPHYEVFRDICQKVIKNISKQDRARIRKDWISIQYDHAFNWSKAFVWLIIASGVIILLFILFYFWNRSLTNQISEKERVQGELEIALNETEKREKEKEILLQEIHHRVKNNLQIIISLMRLQVRSDLDEKTSAAMNKTIDRIKAIALIHDKIYNADNLSNFSTQEYIETLANELIDNFTAAQKIKLEVSTAVKYINLKTIVPIALILNELITNSIKYGLKDKKTGKIMIHLKEENSKLMMMYFDNGNWIENKNSNNFGTSLIEIFTEQLDGFYDLEKTDHGTTYHFEFENL